MKAAGDHGFDPAVLIGVAVMLVLAKIGGELFERMRQPAVLGELFAGIVLGNLVILGFSGAESLKTNGTIAALAELGVIILLFEVGLESDLKEMMEVGWSSLLVAVLGVIAPVLSRMGSVCVLHSGTNHNWSISSLAQLSARPVSASRHASLKTLASSNTREARIILGAAVIDDVLGLLILAVVAGAIKAAGTGGALSMFDIGLIALKSLAFLVGSIAIGHFLDAANASRRRPF